MLQPTLLLTDSEPFHRHLHRIKPASEVCVEILPISLASYLVTQIRIIDTGPPTSYALYSDWGLYPVGDWLWDFPGPFVFQGNTFSP